MPHVQINFLAVIVSAAVALAIGALWYSPLLFAKHWMRAHGYTEESVKEMQKGTAKAYAISILCHVLIALAIAVLVSYLNLWVYFKGLKLGLLIWAGFALPLGLMANTFSDKKLTAFAIDAGYQLVYLLIMGAIITVWR